MHAHTHTHTHEDWMDIYSVEKGPEKEMKFYCCDRNNEKVRTLTKWLLRRQKLGLN